MGNPAYRRFGRFFKGKDGSIIPVEEALPAPSEEKYEEVFKDDLPKIELKEPEEVKANDPTKTVYDAASESTRGVSEELNEETLHSSWIQEILSHRKVKEAWTDKEGGVFMSPIVYLQLAPLAHDAWNRLKGGFKRDPQKINEMNTRLQRLYYNEAIIGSLISQRGADLVIAGPFQRKYFPMVKDLLETWDAVNDCAQKLNFGLAYRKRDPVLDRLEFFKSKPSKGIAKQETQKPITKKGDD